MTAQITAAKLVHEFSIEAVPCLLVVPVSHERPNLDREITDGEFLGDLTNEMGVEGIQAPLNDIQRRPERYPDNADSSPSSPVGPSSRSRPEFPRPRQVTLPFSTVENELGISILRLVRSAPFDDRAYTRSAPSFYEETSSTVGSSAARTPVRCRDTSIPRPERTQVAKPVPESS